MSCAWQPDDLATVALGAAVAAAGLVVMLALLARLSPLAMVRAIGLAGLPELLSPLRLLLWRFPGLATSAWTAALLQLGLVAVMFLGALLVPLIGGMGWAELLARFLGWLLGQALDKAQPVGVLLLVVVGSVLVIQAWLDFGRFLAGVVTLAVVAMVGASAYAKLVGQEHQAVERLACHLREVMGWQVP